MRSWYSAHLDFQKSLTCSFAQALASVRPYVSQIYRSEPNVFIVSVLYRKEKTKYMSQVNRREKDFVWKMLKNAWKSLQLYKKEKPDVVICTGVLAMIPMCLIAKMAGKKLVYIESFAKVTSPTETGKLLYKFADQFYVQWESMLSIYPKAIYLGGIY